MSRFLPAVATVALLLGAVFFAEGMLSATASAPPATAVVAASPTPNVSASSVASTASPPPTPLPPTPLSPLPDGYRIQIPRLAIDLALREGDIERDTIDQQTPEHYAFHLPGTAIPGAGANSYIYAHARVGMFLSLWNVRLGDVVWISTPDGRALRYVVSEIHPRVPPADVTWTEPSPPERLTLQTSTGPNPGDPRFVVIALPG